MIHIRKNQLNKIALSLSELSISTDPQEYRFEFTSENSKDISYSLTLEPVSSTERLQVFEIEEGVDITFDKVGYYNYEVYQTTGNNLVETGLLRVIGEQQVVQQHISSANQQVYGG